MKFAEQDQDLWIWLLFAATLFLACFILSTFENTCLWSNKSRFQSNSSQIFFFVKVKTHFRKAEIQSKWECCTQVCSRWDCSCCKICPTNHCCTCKVRSLPSWATCWVVLWRPATLAMAHFHCWGQLALYVFVMSDWTIVFWVLFSLKLRILFGGLCRKMVHGSFWKQHTETTHRIQQWFNHTFATCQWGWIHEQS